MPLQYLRDAFTRRFALASEVVARAPGRVNLIGEHTDYNEGFVLPIALEQNTWVAAALRPDEQVRAVSLDLEQDETWPIDGWRAGERPHWTSYVAGVAALLRSRGARLPGCNVLIRSDVPVGSGLSSSAALEVATAKALAMIAGEALPSKELADVCREAEHKFAGVPCGIMDQYVSLLAQADAAFLLDCRSCTWEHLPLPLGEHAVVIVNSGVRHELAAGEYGARLRQCGEATTYFRRLNPAVRALRDIEVETVRAHASQLPPLAAARALHVTSENRRTLAAAAALRKRDLAEFGRLMGESHRSLRDDYEVSCRELDRLVEIVGAVPGVVGARMTGAGFGGCMVAIARRDAVPRIEHELKEKYDGAGFGPARLILSKPGAGAAIEFA